MAEELKLPETGERGELYAALQPQIATLIESEDDLVANLANTAAVLHTALQTLWTGFYRVKSDALVLGPFQGPLACTRIPLVPEPRGVCGAAFKRREAVIVPDVEAFPGHIACSSLSRSEIVVPLLVHGRVELVLDIDSSVLDDFDEADLTGLGAVVGLLRARHWPDHAVHE